MARTRNDRGEQEALVRLLAGQVEVKLAAKCPDNFHFAGGNNHGTKLGIGGAHDAKLCAQISHRQHHFFHIGRRGLTGRGRLVEVTVNEA